MFFSYNETSQTKNNEKHWEKSFFFLLCLKIRRKTIDSMFSSFARSIDEKREETETQQIFWLFVGYIFSSDIFSFFSLVLFDCSISIDKSNRWIIDIIFSILPLIFDERWIYANIRQFLDDE